MKQFVKENLYWIKELENYEITDDKVTIISKPCTDLWQRTYYGFQNDNAHFLCFPASPIYYGFSSEYYIKCKIPSKIIAYPFLINTKSILFSFL